MTLSKTPCPFLLSWITRLAHEKNVDTYRYGRLIEWAAQGTGGATTRSLRGIPLTTGISAVYLVAPCCPLALSSSHAGALSLRFSSPDGAQRACRGLRFVANSTPLISFNRRLSDRMLCSSLFSHRRIHRLRKVMSQRAHDASIKAFYWVALVALPERTGKAPPLWYFPTFSGSRNGDINVGTVDVL